MKTFLKVAFFSTVAAGAALAGWRFVRSGPPQPPRQQRANSNGDFAAEGGGPAGELTTAQREQLLEELEEQLGA